MRKSKYSFSHLYNTDRKEYSRLVATEFRKKNPDYYDRYRKSPKDERKVITENIFDELPSDAIPVPNFPTYYVRPNGEIWRDTREIESAIRRGKARVLRLTQTYIPKNGYWIVQPYQNGKRKAIYSHRFILTAFKGPAPDPSMECHHIDHNPSNNAIDNLMWVTRLENAQYVPRSHRSKSKVKTGEGRKESVSKWSSYHHQIIGLYNGGLPLYKIAEKLDIPGTTIYQIAGRLRKRDLM